MPRKTRHNKLTDAESIAAMNPENARLISDYLDYMRSIQRSESTCLVYQNDLEICFVWALKHNRDKFFVDWTKRDIIALQNWLINENGNSPARVRRIKATLSSLSNFLEAICDEDFPNFRNIIHKIESPVSQPVREKTIYSDNEIENLLSILTDQEEFEKACVVALALYGGRRKSELVRFRVSDFDDNKLVCNGALYKSAPLKTKGRGNGKFLQCYTLAKKFKPYLDRWMRYRNEHGIKNEFLFTTPGHPEKPLPVTALDSWAHTFTRITGKDFYWHALRHAHVSMLNREGFNDAVITELLGWADSSLVKVYNDNPADDQIAMFFDENGNIKRSAAKNISDI